MSAGYPTLGSERTRWILERRRERNSVAMDRPYAFFVEQERSGSGEVVDVATVFLTNRECPWKCVMCDLWRNTTSTPVEPGDIPTQIRYALAQLPPAPVLKIYNGGSFFDEGAIPRSEWSAIAELCGGFEHLIVECHPRLIGQKVSDFESLLSCTLEVALGLETVHPAALDRINKRITATDYRRAVRFLKGVGIAVRTFLIVQPPFIPKREQREWLHRSIEFALDCGSDVVSLIPLRAGNGAVEDLIASGEAEEPTLLEIEQAQETGMLLNRGRVFADTWDVERFSLCRVCKPVRRQRLHRMNLTQAIEPRVSCKSCEN